MSWEASGVITLLTDFGSRDPFVGVMKGVILGVNPSARIVDITHEVEPHDVLQAAYLLFTAHRFFPHGTVHAVVVDPGVGSERRAILAVTDRYAYVGPDNGVFSPALAEGREGRAFAITDPRFFRPQVGGTFHGRDVFAPVAAWLSKGVAPDEFGHEIFDYSRLHLPRAAMAGEGFLRGEIAYIDRFGNAMTNVTAEDLDAIADRRLWGSLRVCTGGVEVSGLTRCYADSPPGTPNALVNSWGCVEIYLAQGNASRELGLGRGQPVEVYLADREKGGPSGSEDAA